MQYIVDHNFAESISCNAGNYKYSTLCCHTSYCRPKAIIAWTPLDPGMVFSATKILAAYPLSPIII